MFPALPFLWSLLAIPAAHAGEAPSEPLVLAPIQTEAPALVSPAPRAVWLERARRRHLTAKTGGVLVAVGLPLAVVGFYIVDV